MKSKVYMVFITLFAAGVCSAQTPQQKAKQILSAAGVKGGLVVHIGCDEGKLTAALRDGDSYLVHGLDDDADNIAAARKHIRSQNLYGPVSVQQWSRDYLPYTENTVNLLVADELGDIPRNEVMRVLVPRGVAIIGGQESVKPRPDSMDEWTHFLHDASNNAVGDDTQVGPPRRMKWQAGPRWCRSHEHLASISTTVTGNGRIFYIADEGPTASVTLPSDWKLIARDAFNGVLLWKRDVGPWEGHLRGFRTGPAELTRRLVVSGDTVYASLGYRKPVQALNAATGKVIRTYQQTEGAVELIHKDGALYVVTGDRPGYQKWLQAERRSKPAPPARDRKIIAIRAEDGRTLWQKSDGETEHVLPLSMAASKGRVIYHTVEKLFCLDAESGKEIWSVDRPALWERPAWSGPTVVISDGVVLVADKAVRKKKNSEDRKINWIVSIRGGHRVAELTAYKLEDGDKMWSAPAHETYNAPPDVFVINGLVWTSNNLTERRQPGINQALDLHTGKVARKRQSDLKTVTVGMPHHRCYRNKATSNYLVLGRAGAEFVDLDSGVAMGHHWVRGACQYGVMPANGLLYAPPHSCACFIKAKLNSFNALAPTSDKPVPGRDAPGLTKGPAYGKIRNPKSEIRNSSDWPTYRHDGLRSGATDSQVGANLQQAWGCKLPGGLTSLTAAGGKVFTASMDTHTVYCLDGDSGDVEWSFTADGPVDSPPTIYQDMAIFGCRDGCVYCLRASDGELVWRFQAAPGHRRLVIYNRLESAWPVHGSVLARDGQVVFAAGRSSFLDGGIYLCRLEARTGKTLSRTRLWDYQNGKQPPVRGFEMEGALPDILSSDGNRIYMRHKVFDLKGNPTGEPHTHLFSPIGFLDESWWHRSYWMWGSKFDAGWGGWWHGGNRRPAGRIMCVGADKVYSFGRSFYSPGNAGQWNEGEKYLLFATGRNAGKDSGRPGRKKYETDWSQTADFQVRAMALAGNKIFAAGPLGTGTHSMAEFTGEKGIILRVLDTSDGAKLAQYELDTMPVWDGLITAGGKVYLTMHDNRLICLKERQNE